MASQITSPTLVYSTVHSGADQRKHQSSASLAFVRGIHWWLSIFPHKWPVTRKMFPFDDVIMLDVIKMSCVWWEYSVSFLVAGLYLKQSDDDNTITNKKKMKISNWKNFSANLTQLLYCKISNIRSTKSQNLNDPHLLLPLSLFNPLKPGVKSRMNM